MVGGIVGGSLVGGIVGGSLAGGIVGDSASIGGNAFGGRFPPTGVGGRVDSSSRPSRRSNGSTLFLFLSGCPSKNHLLIVVLRSIDYFLEETRRVATLQPSDDRHLLLED
jgi:hypothetical protein